MKRMTFFNGRNPILSLFSDTLSRKRHSKGFGVHSPFAYRFVTDVIKTGPYGYYAYDRLERDTNLSARETNEARFFIRLAVFLNASRFLLYPGTPRVVKAAAKALGKSVIETDSTKKIKFREGDLIVVHDSGLTLETLSEAIDSGASVLALSPSPEISDFLSKPLTKGLLLRAKEKILLIPRQEMEYVAYKIAF